MTLGANEWNSTEVRSKMHNGGSVLSVQELELELVPQTGISEAHGTLFFYGYLMMQVMWRDTGGLSAH